MRGDEGQAAIGAALTPLPIVFTHGCKGHTSGLQMHHRDFIGSIHSMSVAVLMRFIRYVESVGTPVERLLGLSGISTVLLGNPMPMMSSIGLGHGDASNLNPFAQCLSK
jgi:hypothetical protein